MTSHGGMEFGAVEFRALGTSAVVLVTEPGRVRAAERTVRARLDALDLACSRFRADSELSRLRAGVATRISPLLAEALAVALRAAGVTGGLVDPTVGTAVRELGYDRDFATMAKDDPRPFLPRPAPGWHRVLLDVRTGEVVVPRGVEIDLGATAKAMAADGAAQAVAREAGCGALVNLGGDIGVAGPPPPGGWQIAVADDHALARREPQTTVSIRSGGLATSSTTVRSWTRAGRRVHHIVDPRTGESPEPCWRTVSVAAGSCVDANIATTASILLGRDAPAWLGERRLPARLVRVTGEVVELGGWPRATDEKAA
ncbi:MAG: thiamine biosynthesis protein [Amycolatopsis sp.]|nr:thiamine biosynthesis protein [Amycolatopsis sp.]